MTQATWTIPVDQTGTQYRTQDNQSGDAFGSTHKGASRPSYAITGMMWLDDSADPTWSLYLYDGGADILIGTINSTTNVFTPANSFLINGSTNYASDTGAANAYVVSIDSSITSYTAGLLVLMKATNANTGASTVNANSIGVANIKKNGTTDLAANDIVANGLYLLVHDGTNFQLVGGAGGGSAYPTGFRGTATPVYSSTTQFTVAHIRDRDSTDASNITKAGSTTVDVSTTDLNGIAQSANLTGTIVVNSGSAAITGTGTTFLADFQVGDVLASAGGQSRRIITVTDNTNMVAESNFSSNESGVTFKRGGRAPSTWYYLYSTDDGTTPGLILSTRNVAGGDTLVDLPSGYTVSRQQAFALRLNSSSNILPFVVGEGWPTRPVVYWDDVDIDDLNSGNYTLYYDFTTNPTSYGSATDCSALVPALSRSVPVGTYTDGGGNFSVRANGASNNGWQIEEPRSLVIRTDASQQIQVKANVGGRDVHIWAIGFIVTEMS